MKKFTFACGYDYFELDFEENSYSKSNDIIRFNEVKKYVFVNDIACYSALEVLEVLATKIEDSKIKAQAQTFMAEHFLLGDDDQDKDDN